MKRIQGTGHTDPTRWSSIVTQYGALLPESPTVAVKVAITLHPPLLPAQGEKHAMAVLVARGYFSACMEIYGSCRALKAPTAAALNESGHILVFAGAIDVMRKYHLAPAAWSMFSVEVWRDYVVGGMGGAWDKIPSKRRGPRADSQPKPNWVFSAKRLEERTGWFAWAKSKYAGGRMIFTPSLRRMVLDQARLKMRLLTSKELTEDIVKKLTDPFRSLAYGRLVAAANDEAEEHMENLEKRVKRGEWVW